MPLILIADDDLAYSTLLGDLLRSDGYEVEAISDAGQLDSRLTAHGFNAAILDMQMPMGGGPVAAKRIRAHYANVTIPIIVCSGMPIEMAQPWFKGMAKVSIFQKPTNFLALLIELRRLLSEP